VLAVKVMAEVLAPSAVMLVGSATPGAFQIAAAWATLVPFASVAVNVVAVAPAVVGFLTPETVIVTPPLVLHDPVVSWKVAVWPLTVGADVCVQPVTVIVGDDGKTKPAGKVTATDVSAALPVKVATLHFSTRPVAMTGAVKPPADTVGTTAWACREDWATVASIAIAARMARSQAIRLPATTCVSSLLNLSAFPAIGG
jgi:hypothetical protein